MNTPWPNNRHLQLFKQNKKGLLKAADPVQGTEENMEESKESATVATHPQKVSLTKTTFTLF